LGNVLGSSIFNVLFILGISALIIPLRVSQQLVRFDVPLMICLSILVLVFAYDGRIGRFDGLLLASGLIAYIVWSIIKSRGEEAVIRDEYSAEFGLPDGHGMKSMLLQGLLVAVGRRPNTQGLGLEELGVELDPRSGQVLVDEQFRTKVKSVYAIGDLIPGPALAHTASAEGIAAVECIAGLPGEVNYDAIPSIIYTWPEVASVGLTEEQVKERSIPYCVGTYPFSGAGRARCMGEKDGFVKMIAHAKTDRILGVHILGPRASDMISECVLAVEFGASSEDIARTVHGHPTFAEALQEAAMAVRKCSIYAS
jgi:pyruvate/2-oxoglutarate dehydrogenase complex dihydrolipoamide dehydrogenase (E3) component